MGILVQKKQAGGIFGDPRYLVLNAQNASSGQQRGYGQARPNYAKPMSGGAAKPKDDIDFEGMLSSDIDYYRREEARIRKAREDGLAADKDFDKTPAYELLLQEKYALESKFAPKMKSMYKFYEKNKAIFNKNGAADAPALLNGMAIVYDAQDESYKAIKEAELLRNAKQYKLLNGSDVLIGREKRVDFSGFTPLGMLADQFINNAYGSTAFEKEIDTKIKRVGYVKGPSGYEHVDSKNILNLNNVKYDKHGLTIKSNSTNMLELLGQLGQDGNTQLNTYLRNKSVDSIYRRAQGDDAYIKEFNDAEVGKIIADNAAGHLNRYLKTSVVIDANKRAADNKKSGSTKNIKRSVWSMAVFNLLTDTESIEVDNINSTDPALGSLINDMPATYIQQGPALLDWGYGDAVQGDDEDDVVEHKRRVIVNNRLLHDVASGKSKMTVADGTDIMEFVDDNDSQYITTHPRPNMYMLLAPVLEDERGKEYVNFKNEYSFAIMRAIDKTYAELKEKNISSTELAKGDPDLLAQAEKIAKKYLKEEVGEENIKNAPVIKAAISFDVLYETDSNHSDTKTAPYASLAQSGDVKILESIIDEPKGFYTEYSRTAKVFMPISRSFWQRMMTSSGSFPDRFFDTYTPSEWEGVATSKPTISILDMTPYMEGKAYEVNKKRMGGKLLSSEDIRYLLYN